MTVLAPTAWWKGLGGLTRSGSSLEALAWALYDFANTIFSFAIVSFAMSLWAIRYLGEADGTFWFTAAVSVSVLINAIVSPILGAMSDRVGKRKPFLAFFTIACVAGTAVIGLVDIRLGLAAFVVANFAYQAALIYYDALLPDVARPLTRGRLSGIGVALGYCGTLLVGGLLLLGITIDNDQLDAGDLRARCRPVRRVRRARCSCGSTSRSAPARRSAPSTPSRRGRSWARPSATLAPRRGSSASSSRGSSTPTR